MRIAALLLTVLTAPASDATVCAQFVPPTPAERFERDIRVGRAFRRQLEIPASRAVVVRALRSDDRQLVFGQYAMTPREAAFVRRRNRQGSSPVFEELNRYGLSRPGSFAGLRVGSDFPRGAAAVVSFSSGLARHRAALRDVDAPFPVRIEKVRYSLRELSRVQRRIADDIKVLRRRGIAVSSIGAYNASNRVTVEYVSAREGVSRILRRRYGPTVIGDRVARKPTRLVCTEVTTADPSADGRSLALEYFTNSEYVFERVFIEESADRVRIGIVERAPNGGVTLAGAQREAEATLGAPLGDRELVHAVSGRPIR